MKCFAIFHELNNFLRLLANQGGRFSLQNIRMSELFERWTVHQSIADGLPMYPVIYKLQGYWLNQVLGDHQAHHTFCCFFLFPFTVSSYSLSPTLSSITPFSHGRARCMRRPTGMPPCCRRGEPRARSCSSVGSSMWRGGARRRAAAARGRERSARCGGAQCGAAMG